MSDKAFLYGLQTSIEPHLERIEKILPKEYRLTLVARHTTMPEAEIVLTLDNLWDVIACLEKVASRIEENRSEGGSQLIKQKESSKGIC